MLLVRDTRVVTPSRDVTPVVKRVLTPNDQGYHEGRTYTPANGLSSDIGSALDRALETGTVEVGYQLKRGLHAAANPSERLGRYCGAEALLRLQDPDKTGSGPTHFPPHMVIAYAAETGMLPLLDEVIFRQACNQVAAWHASGIALPVSVNVDPRALLGDGTRATRYAQIAKETGVPKGAISVELTEEECALTPKQLYADVSAFYELGFPVALDDMGTGAHAGEKGEKRADTLPVHEVKLDREYFIGTEEERAAKAQIVGLLIGRILRCPGPDGQPKRIVVEGVSVKQAQDLAMKGCYAAQSWDVSGQAQIPHKIGTLMETQPEAFVQTDYR